MLKNITFIKMNLVIGILIGITNCSILNNKSQQPNQSTTRKVGRIQEKRSYGGEVQEIKVDNSSHKLPSYYVTPPANVDFTPDNQTGQNVATPTWQLKW